MFIIKQTCKWGYPYPNVVETRYYGTSKETRYTYAFTPDEIKGYVYKELAIERMNKLKIKAHIGNYKSEWEIIEIGMDTK